MLTCVVAASFAQASCSSGGGAEGTLAGDDALIVPATLTVGPRARGNGTLDVVALTLGQGATHLELYAAVKNSGTTPACSPAFSVELFDRAEQSLGQSVGGLVLKSFYRRTDDSEAIAACVAPGELSMIAMRDLPADVDVEDVARVEYWCNYWVLDVVPTSGIRLTDVHPVTKNAGVAYAGTLVNDFDVPLGSPSVAVFQLNRAGRPLGVALGGSAVELPPTGSWQFETDTVSAQGVTFAAYPASGP